MLDTSLRNYIRPVTDKLARFLLLKLPITPNQITWAGLGFGGLACLFAMYSFTSVALFFIVLNRLADGLDGALARVKAETDLFYRNNEPRGKFLDIICDHLFFAAYPLAVAIGIHTDTAYLAAAIMLFALLALGSTSLAYGLMLANAPAVKPVPFQLSNLAEEIEIIVYIILVTLLPEIYVWLTIPFALFCLVSAFGRIHQAYRMAG